MLINFEAKDVHLVVTDQKGEVALAYSINEVNSEVNAPLLLQLLTQLLNPQPKD